MLASMRAPMMCPQAVMKYWHAVRTAYSAMNSARIHPNDARTAPAGWRKNSLVKKFRNWGNARSMHASTVAHTRSNQNRNLNGR